MEKNRSRKRLTLSKQTLRILRGPELRAAQGGFCVETDPDSTAGGGGPSRNAWCSAMGQCQSMMCPSVIIFNCPPETGVTCQANSNCGCTYD